MNQTLAKLVKRQEKKTIKRAKSKCGQCWLKYSIFADWTVLYVYDYKLASNIGSGSEQLRGGLTVSFQVDSQLQMQKKRDPTITTFHL